jgi:hypothetical protein
VAKSFNYLIETKFASVNELQQVIQEGLTSGMENTNQFGQG